MPFNLSNYNFRRYVYLFIVEEMKSLYSEGFNDSTLDENSESFQKIIVLFKMLYSSVGSSEYVDRWIT